MEVVFLVNKLSISKVVKITQTCMVKIQMKLHLLLELIKMILRRKKKKLATAVD
jgi:hypothetical protein